MESSFDFELEKSKQEIPRVESNPFFRSRYIKPRGSAQQALARYKGDFNSYIEKRAKPHHKTPNKRAKIKFPEVPSRKNFYFDSNGKVHYFKEREQHGEKQSSWR